MTAEARANLLRNAHLQGWSKPAFARSVGDLLPEWGFEHKAHEPVLVHQSGSAACPGGGVAIELVKPGSRFRLWQELRFDASPRPQRLAANVRLGKLHPGAAGLTVDWISLLQIGAGGKRIFSVRPTQMPILIASDEIVDLCPSFMLPPLAAAMPLLFTIQLKGGAGAVRLESVALYPEAPADGRAAVAEPHRPRPTATPPRLSQPIVTLDDGTIEGVIDFAEGDEEILSFVDGKLIGASKLARPAAGSTGRSFRLKIPDLYLDGGVHSVGLRRSGGQRIGSVFKLTLPDPRRIATPAPEQRPVAPPPAPLPARTRRVCVVAWDMAHNPVGRAYLLAEMAARTNRVELCGPCFPAYGTAIWPPIAQAALPVHAFPATDFAAFIAGARALAERVTCDAVIVGKARFPSLLIGALIKQANGCPMIVDVDDHELSFFDDRTPASLDQLLAAISADPALLDTPYTEIFTRYAEGLIAACDGVTISNHALQARFGGIVVRHGRDETLFDPAAFDRDAIRADYGYGARDRVILFLGTPRPHKGVFEIADALEAIGDDRLALCVIGTINDKRVGQRFAAYRRARIALHPDQPWARLPELVSMADAVFLLQDPDSPISAYQMPAKLTDAIALGIAVYATPVAPLRDLIAAGIVAPIASEADLHAALRTIAQEQQDERAGERARDVFLGELSYKVNGARIDLAIDRAMLTNRKIVPEFDALFDGIERVADAPLPRFGRRWVAPAIWKSVPPDLIFLWKQNDSDIYGRRSDMLVKYLLRSGAVNKVLHLDAPISLDDLEKHAREGSQSAAHQGKLVYLNSVRRVLRLADDERLIRRTFLHRTPKGPDCFLGIDLPQRQDYPAFIREAARTAGLCDHPILWVSPVIFDYRQIKDAIDPSCVIADIIDDQRSFKSREDHRKRIVRAYEEILTDADLVFANCEPVRTGFAPIRPDIHVVPNGAEPFDLKQMFERPGRLTDLPRPILGYVGNLRDRIDLPLVRRVADAFPDATIVLIGSAHDRADIVELDRLSNVHLLGVKPYAEVIAYIRSFDVAIMPHVRNSVSNSMNPLKLYVYFALGVPIVSTDVANIDEIGEVATIAPTHEAFIAAIRDVIGGKIRAPSARRRNQIMQHVSWPRRIDAMLRTIGLVA